jgi:hypothetical protein
MMLMSFQQHKVVKSSQLVAAAMCGSLLRQCPVVLQQYAGCCCGSAVQTLPDSLACVADASKVLVHLLAQCQEHGLVTQACHVLVGVRVNHLRTGAAAAAAAAHQLLRQETQLLQCMLQHALRSLVTTPP